MSQKQNGLFGPVKQISNLRTGLADMLHSQIETGALAPGQKLPTEQALMAETGVSRTVVREALATLRAKGLITTRQGLGAFVSANPALRSFSVIPADLESIEEVLQVLELRLGIEAEAASLAAKRRTDADLEQMEERLDALDEAMKAGDAGADEDFAFHRAILAATHNPYYARLIDAFGSAMVPKQWTRLETLTVAERRQHSNRMRGEHRAILRAIRDGNDAAARKALCTHLTRSAARFSDLRQRADLADVEDVTPTQSGQ